MNMSIYRITATLLLVAFSFQAAYFQNIDIGYPVSKPAILKQTPKYEGVNHTPTCAFDVANETSAMSNPTIKKELEEFVKTGVPVLATAGQSESAEELLTISVVVHIIHNGEPVGQGQNLSDEQVYAQMAILNEDYSAINNEYFETPQQWAGVRGVPNIEFCLASVDPSGNPTNGITRHNLQVTGSSYHNSNINTSIKPQTDWNSSKYMNIWVLPIPGTTSSGGVVGVSNYPIPSQIGQDRDGVVIDYRWFGAPGYAASGYRPLTHETGHFLGLPHTFDDYSCSDDDGIADTPNISDASANLLTLNCSDGYPAGPVTCGNEAMYVNYMDYVNENCYTSFTQGQVNVMRAVLNGTSQGYGYGSRLSLIQNAPQQCNLPNHDAGIVRIIAPNEVNCTAGAVIPSVTLRNFGQEALTSVTIFYKTGNGPLLSHNWQGMLSPGDNADVDLPAHTLPDGLYDFTVYTSNPNGMADERVSNDSFLMEQLNYQALEPNLIATFENNVSLPTSEGIYALDIDNDGFKWQLTTQASAYGQGTKSAVFNNFENGLEGTLDGLITRHYDLTNIPDAILVFDVAYAQKSVAESDSLIILVQTDCSQLYNQIIYWKGGADLSTAPNTSSLFTPSPTQWRTEALNLSAFAGQPDISLAFINLSGGGNRLFIDNIRFGRSCNAIATSFTVEPNGCNPMGSCTGSAEVSVENDHGGLHFQWSGQPANYDNSLLENLCAGSVTVTITDAFGCQVTASTVIPQSGGPSLNISATPETTYNGQNGTATAVASNGIGPFSYFWSNGEQQLNAGASSTIDGLAPGSYSVTVEDANECTAVSQVTVGSMCAGFGVTVQKNNVTCFNSDNGNATAIPSSGTAPFGFLWNNGQTSATAVNLTAGSYTVTVTDSNGCPASASTVISQPTPLQPNLSVTNETAFNANDGTASVNPSGSNPLYSYLWNTGSTASSISGLSPGDYTVTITDSAGCTSSATGTVQSVSCGGFQVFINSTDVSCFGEQDGMASINIEGAQPPVSIFWSNFFISPTIFNLPPGSYSVSVTDAAGCNSVLSTIIAEPPVLQLSVSHTDETSVGANDGAAQATPVGGVAPYNFLWSNGMTGTSVGNLAPGNYTVTVTDANECPATASFSIDAFNCSLSLNLTSADATCPNVADGSAQVIGVPGATGPFEYQWSNGSDQAIAQNLLPGIYGVTVTDANGCTVSGQAVVAGEDNTSPVVMVVDSLTVYLNQNGQAVLDAQMLDAGSFDNCSLIGLAVSTSFFSCQDLGENVVQVTANDASGNTASKTVSINVVDNVPPALNCPTDFTTHSCQGVEYATPLATDNCQVENVELTAGLASGAVFPLGETMVEWQATDAAGNVSTCAFTILVETDLAIALIDVTEATTGQSNGVIEVMVSGGDAPYTFQWSQNGQPLPGFDPSQAPAGTYNLTVTDEAGCTAMVTDIVVDEASSLAEYPDFLDLSVYPNPSTRLVQVNYGKMVLKADIQVLDITGKNITVITTQQSHDKIMLDFNGNPPGIYWLKFLADSRLYWQKIILL